LRTVSSMAATSISPVARFGLAVSSGRTRRRLPRRCSTRCAGRARRRPRGPRRARRPVRGRSRHAGRGTPPHRGLAASPPIPQRHLLPRVLSTQSPASWVRITDFPLSVSSPRILRVTLARLSPIPRGGCRFPKGCGQTCTPHGEFGYGRCRFRNSPLGNRQPRAARVSVPGAADADRTILCRGLPGRRVGSRWSPERMSLTSPSMPPNHTYGIHAGRRGGSACRTCRPSGRPRWGCACAQRPRDRIGLPPGLLVVHRDQYRSGHAAAGHETALGQQRYEHPAHAERDADARVGLLAVESERVVAAAGRDRTHRLVPTSAVS